MRLNFIILVFILVLSNMFFVSAQYFGYGFGTEQVINSLVSTIEPVLRFLLGGYSWNGYMLFEKLLLTIIIISVTYLSLKNVPVFKDSRPGVLRLISTIVGLLGVRNLNDLWLNSVFIQYQVLFVFVGAFIPFLIVWGLLKDLDPMTRKIGWVFYAIIYTGLWYTTDVNAHKDIYLWTVAFVIVYAFFLDHWLTIWLKSRKAYEASHDDKLIKIASINRKIQELENTPVINRYFTQGDKDKLISKLVKLREKLGRTLHY